MSEAARIEHRVHERVAGGGADALGQVPATSPRYSEGPRGTLASPVCWKYSSGRPAMPMLVRACERKVLPLRGVVQMRYEDVGAP